MFGKLTNQPLLLEHGACRDVILESMRFLRSGQKLPTDKMLAQSASGLEKNIQRVDSGEIVILPLRGLIEFRLSMFGWMFGGTPCEAFGAAFQRSIDDSRVNRIVIDVSSPGGTYPGIPELAAQIFSQRNAKGVDGIVSISNPQCSSGAIWVASAAQKLFVLGSGAAGSIGTYSLHTEYSKYFAAAGITHTMIRDPEGKAAWNSFEPLSETERKIEQQVVSTITDEFVSVMAKHRSVSKAHVRKNFGQGREMSARDCVSSGLCDGALSLHQVIGREKKNVATIRADHMITNPRLKLRMMARRSAEEC